MWTMLCWQIELQELNSLASTRREERTNYECIKMTENHAHTKITQGCYLFRQNIAILFVVALLKVMPNSWQNGLKIAKAALLSLVEKTYDT